ncbi:TetR/AcrR family transcriptional regulator [Nocardiopsis valliformis]|uniref:TetR/AcrR family transcriptional regulator n=1 Tax=Nocardiopsis valliformis TaxID=239974 RepID=UPI00034B03A2|nr:TetR/AcrR family transcriptional regulator [Nocardiopsis valliformis]
MSPSANPAPTEREARADRILDAAEELMVAWGHRKTTIDDVARRAGIGKGTVYLHFPTKERLFLTVVLRAQFSMVSRLITLLREEPDAIRPSEIARNIYLLQFESPIIRGLYTDDTEALGAISSSVAHLVGDLVEARQKVLRDYWGLLAEHGVLSSRIPAEQQYYVYSTTVIGYLVSEPLLAQQGFPIPDRTARADLIARSVRLLLEQDVSENAMRNVQAGAITLFEGLRGLLADEIQEQKRVKRST